MAKTLCYCMSVYSKYNKLLLEPLVRDSISYSEVVRKLGKRPGGGGLASHVKKLIQKFEIDTSHFLGQGSNRGATHKGGCAKKTASEILIFESRLYRQNALQLRRALDEIGVPYMCSICKIEQWNKIPLRLQIDHINGDCYDNRKENLRYLCPNCHSQTENYGYKKRK